MRSTRNALGSREVYWTPPCTMRLSYSSVPSQAEKARDDYDDPVFGRPITTSAHAFPGLGSRRHRRRASGRRPDRLACGLAALPFRSADIDPVGGLLWRGRTCRFGPQLAFYPP